MFHHGVHMLDGMLIQNERFGRLRFYNTKLQVHRELQFICDSTRSDR